MKFRKFVIILGFLWWATDGRAQAPSDLPSMPQQWQLTLDVIKARAQRLLIQNNDIQVEYRQLVEQAQKLRQAIKYEQDKNEAMLLFLKERHNRTDQQVRIDQLNEAVKTKRQQAKISEEQLENLKKKQADLANQIQLQRRRISDIQLHQANQNQGNPSLKPPVVPAVDGQLTDLRNRLEEENKQEVILENSWNTLKSGGQSQNLNVDTIEEQNKQLALRLKDLQEQKLQHPSKSANAALALANQKKYDELKKRKDQLEADINSYETRIDQLKDSSILTLSWPLQKKKLIHEMVQMDAHNNQLREKIKMLREDVDVLRDQVAKFERRVNFIQGKDNTQGQ